MDKVEFRDILPKIFTKLLYTRDIHLVCKLWNDVYKYTLSTRNIAVKYRGTIARYRNIRNINVCSLYIKNSSIHDFDNFTNICYLEAFGFSGLQNICENNLEKLVKLDINSCNIDTLPNLKHLKSLSIANCHQIKTIENYGKLRKLIINKCPRIDFIPCMENLEILYVSECENLTSVCYNNNELPIKLKEICIYYGIRMNKLPNNLFNLEKLILEFCGNIENIEGTLNYAKKIKYLNVSSLNNITNIYGLPNLEVLYTNDCVKLTNINQINNIKELYINYCKGLTNLPDDLENLERLQMINCENIENINILEHAHNLKYLCINNCDQLTDIPNILNLEILCAEDCNGFVVIKNLSKIKSLYLNSAFNINLYEFSKNSSYLENLEYLDITSTLISDISILENSKKLKYLDISECNITVLPRLDNLEELRAINCKNLISISNISNKIRKLNINLCVSLINLPTNLENLEKLYMEDCINIRNLDSLKNSAKLLRINVIGCDKLKILPDFLRLLNNLRIIG